MQGDVPVEGGVRSSAVALRLLHGLVDGFAHGSLTMGEIASLRRMDARDPDIRHLVALFRVLASLGIEYREEDWPRIVLTANCVALARGQHDGGSPTGSVLHQMGLGEQRLNGLLSADLDGLTDLLPRLARRIGVSGLRIDLRPLVLLVWWADRDESEADRQRRLIATGYLRAAARSGVHV